MQIQKDEYKQFIVAIKSKIQSSQIKASIKVNVELLKLYWDIAEMIVEKQKGSAWGTNFIEQISKDLKREFPNMKGFSKTNLLYMKKWYLFWNDENLPQVVGEIYEIPWGHNREIITKIKNIDEAHFYVQKTTQNNWSRVVLLHQIESNLYSRSPKSINNFDKNLPSPQSDLAKALLKDPYHFDFLNLREKHDELELEDALMEHMTKFLLELGNGFAFVGRQYKLTVGYDEFRIDLLFYHVKLKCYIVVELKTVKFKPEFAGQLNFYVSAIDGEIKEPNDNPTLGILICKSKNDTVVEYALQRIDSPIGVSNYELTHVLPNEFKSSLPSIEEIEAELKDEK
jgi:predicted nuclease of restriction endonuclease-like (RecB) superfamily